MQLITQGKTNYIFLIIIFVVAVIAGGLVWWMSGGCVQELEIERIDGQTSDIEFLKESPLFGDYESFNFGEAKVANFVIEEANYGPPYDQELYQLFPLDDDFCQINSQDKYCGFLFAKSRKVNLKNYLNQEIQINYRPVEGIIIGEQQLVIVDSVAEDKTANWQTYTNEEYGFEIKYPPKEEMLDNEITIVSLYQDPTYKGIRLGELRFGCSMHIYSEIDDEFMSLLAEHKEEYGEPQYVVSKIVESNGKKYYLGFSIASHAVHVESCQPFFNQMLSTFRFLDKKDIQQAEMLHYEKINSETGTEGSAVFGIGVDYPSDWTIIKEEIYNDGPAVFFSPYQEVDLDAVPEAAISALVYPLGAFDVTTLEEAADVYSKQCDGPAELQEIILSGLPGQQLTCNIVGDDEGERVAVVFYTIKNVDVLDQEGHIGGAIAYVGTEDNYLRHKELIKKVVGSFDIKFEFLPN